MSFTTPAALLLFLLIPYFIWLGRPSTSMVGWRRALSLGLRVAIMSLLTLALAGTQVVRAADELAVVFLVDASDSINFEQAEQAEEYVRAAIETMAPNDKAGVVVFGSNSLVERPVSGLAELTTISSVPSTIQTDLAEAIRLGLALFPAGSGRRMVVLSDGAATIGNTQEAARLAAASNVQIDFVPLVRSAVEAEVWVTDVGAPTRVSEGEVFGVQISAESTTNQAAQLRIYSGGTIVYDETVNLNVGSNNFTARLRAATADFNRFTVELTPSNDTFAQNNRLGAFTEVIGPPRVLLVSSDGTPDDNGAIPPDEAAQMVFALRSVGLSVDVASPEQLPVDLASLSDYASVVLVNVNAKNLSPRKMDTLKTYVRDLGGGLVVVGGPESYGMGGYFKTPLEEALPVDMQIKDTERFPSVSIAIVIDRSGSMGIEEGGVTKILLAAEAAGRVVELLNPTDEITIITVDTQPDTVIGPLPATESDEILDRLSTLGAGGGGIYVRTGMQAAADRLAQSQNLVKHVIVLADGSDSEEKNGVPELISALTADGTTISMVAIGDGKDVPWLRDMAEDGNGRFHLTDRAANLPQIFTQETTNIQRNYLIEERFFPTLVSRSPILSGIDSVPPLYGYVGTSAKDTAQVVLETAQEDPLLAQWQFGLGRTVAWTSDATGRWATEWVEWESFPTFWAQTVRWTIQQNRDSAVETAVNLRNNSAELIVDARAGDGEFLNNMTMEANVVAPSGEVTGVILEQVAPGRYAADFTPEEEGAYFIRVAGTNESGEVDGVEVAQTSGWVLDYSPEYRQFAAQPQLLESIADLTNGRDLTDNIPAVFEHSLESGRTIRPISQLLLLLAILLLPFDIAVRRLVVTRTDLERLWAWSFGRFRRQQPIPQTRTEQASRLFEAKQRAQTQMQSPPPTPIQTPPPEDGAAPTEPAQSTPAPSLKESADSKPSTPSSPTASPLASRLLKKRQNQQTK